MNADIEMDNLLRYERFLTSLQSVMNGKYHPKYNGNNKKSEMYLMIILIIPVQSVFHFLDALGNH